MNKRIRNIIELRKVVEAFRNAIVLACKNGEFDRKDRMSNFPYGCCDDACDLLGYYLSKEFDLHTKQGNGLYDDGIFENRTNHAWLVFEDDTVIDITGTQFKYCAGFSEEVYIDCENSFYKNLERKILLDNYDIEQSERLWNDYLIITQYIVRQESR